ncbi:MAG: hypothetical protein B7Z47_01900 [Chthoniobacter sp. 12-60-6]|nr:MAG: hypothetical protein B7Z47_01900 [Chthoniobacter sp. 12-60-6]
MCCHQPRHRTARGRIIDGRKRGRAVAQGHGLRTIGVVGILIQARHAGFLAAISPVIDDLRIRAKFRLSDALVRHALNMCQE